MPEETNGWRGRMEATIEEHDRRLSKVEDHPMACGQIAVVQDHEKRLRTLEAFRWQIMGALILINGISVAVILGAMKSWLR